MECSSSPCKNSPQSGGCLDGIDSFTCICSKGWGGDTCGTVVDNCGSSPCQNDGACTNKFTNRPKGLGYVCSCKKGFTGDECQTDVDECSSMPCANGGKCTGTGICRDTFKCACKEGFERGDRCSPNICPLGFTGDYCQTNWWWFIFLCFLALAALLLFIGLLAYLCCRPKAKKTPAPVYHKPAKPARVEVKTEHVPIRQESGPVKEWRGPAVVTEHRSGQTYGQRVHVETRTYSPNREAQRVSHGHEDWAKWSSANWQGH